MGQSGINPEKKDAGNGEEKGTRTRGMRDDFKHLPERCPEERQS